MSVQVHRDAIEQLKFLPEVAEALGAEASKIAPRVRIHGKNVTVFSRHGVGRRGAFAQVIMRGSGAKAIEFGSRNNPPLAPLRKALSGGGR